MSPGPISASSATTHRVTRVRGSLWRPGDVATIGSIEISVGNPRCRSPFLEPQIDWALERYAEVMFSVGDLLQTYNYVELGHPVRGRLSLAEAKAVASAEGDAWIVEHHSMLEHRFGSTSPTIMRWADWREQDGFAERLHRLNTLYDHLPAFRDAVDGDVVAYVARREPARVLSDRSRSHLAQFLIEELAVFQLQAEQAPTVHIYAGGRMRLDRIIAGIPQIPGGLRGRRFAYLEIRATD